MTSRTPDPASFLPLKPARFHILLALGDGPRHGFSIREVVEARTDGGVKLWPATLYGAVRDMSDEGLVEPLEGDEDPDDDQRRRYYRLTRLGREVLHAEADRLQSLANAARQSAALGQT